MRVVAALAAAACWAAAAVLIESSQTVWGRLTALPLALAAAAFVAAFLSTFEEDS